MAAPLVRWEPFADIAELRGRFDRLFQELTAGGEHRWTPAIDIRRHDGDLVIRADVPGVKPEEISVEVDRGILTISGEHEDASEQTEEGFVRRERRYGAFSRSLAIPEGTDPKKIDAEVHDGVLEVHVPMPKAKSAGKVTIKPKAAS